MPRVIAINNYTTHEEAKRWDFRIESPHKLHLHADGSASIAFLEAEPIIGEDLRYILDLYEDDEISHAELIRQAQSVGYSAEEVQQILEGCQLAS